MRAGIDRRRENAATMTPHRPARLALLLAAAAAAVPRPALGQETDAGSRLSTLEVGDLKMRVAEQGEGPLVLLLHGFPELGYSWRHQLGALAAAGYRAVAPDMRGYGGTDAPQAVEAYDMVELAGDVARLVDALGEERAALVGHDWGAVVAWYSVLLHPQRFTGLAALSVPYGGRAASAPLAALRERYGERFFYMLYFQEPGVAEAELDPDPRALFVPHRRAPRAPRVAHRGGPGALRRGLHAHGLSRRSQLLPQLRPHLGAHARGGLPARRERLPSRAVRELPRQEP